MKLITQIKEVKFPYTLENEVADKIFTFASNVVPKEIQGKSSIFTRTGGGKDFSGELFIEIDGHGSSSIMYDVSIAFIRFGTVIETEKIKGYQHYTGVIECNSPIEMIVFDMIDSILK